MPVKPITYNGQLYESIAKLARTANIPSSLICDRLKRGMTIEKAVNTPKQINYRHNHYVYDHVGKKYESIDEMCSAYNQKKATYEKRIHVMNWTKEQALTTPPQKTTPITCDFNNTTYKSINEFCKANKISRSAYYSAIQKNKPIDKIQRRPPKEFKIIKLAYTHNNIDYYEYLHNNQKYIFSIREMKGFTENDHDTG